MDYCLNYNLSYVTDLSLWFIRTLLVVPMIHFLFPLGPHSSHACSAAHSYFSSSPVLASSKETIFFLPHECHNFTWASACIPPALTWAGGGIWPASSTGNSSATFLSGRPKPHHASAAAGLSPGHPPDKKTAKYVCRVGCSGQSKSRWGALLHLAPNLEAAPPRSTESLLFLFFSFESFKKWIWCHGWAATDDSGLNIALGQTNALWDKHKKKATRDRDRKRYKH